MPDLSPAELAARAAFDAAAKPGAGGAEPDPLAQIVATEQLFQAACTTGDVPPLTLDSDDWDNAPADTAQRQAAIHKRLRRLGYPVPDALPAGATGDALWAVLRPAWAQFQTEAFGAVLPDDLKPGELAATDWDALQELFNFETAMRVERWFDGDTPRPALQRAARLRLQVAGFGTGPVGNDFAPSPEALRGFAQTAHDLGVTPAPLAPALTPAYAAVLFDYDGLTDALARSGDRLAQLDGPAAERAKNFLVCVAKVELWLHGRDSRPDGDATLAPKVTVIGGHGNVHRVEQPHPFVAEFERFMRENGRDVTLRRAADLPSRVPELLAISQPPRAGGERLNSTELVEQLQGLLVQDNSLWGRIVAAGKGLVSSLFDGAKRVFSWLGRLLRRGIDAVKQAVKDIAATAVNLWRGVYHFMGGAAFHLRRALRAFGDGVEFLFNPVLRTDPADSAIYARRIDCDGAMIVDPAADSAAVVALGESLARGAKCFAIACRIVRLITTAVRTVLATGAGGLVGFAPLILGLASAYQQVRELGRMLEQLGG